MKNKKNKEKKKFTFLGMSIWRVFAYFIIYSILGFIIETLFGLVTKGVIESRQSFLYGPFCAIYGLGAVIMIGMLQYFNKNNFSLFFGGFLIGSVVEYLVSLFGEMMLHVKWWDYSNMPLNINGRICLETVVPFGILGCLVMYVLNPITFKYLNMLSNSMLNIISAICFTIFITDNIVSYNVISSFTKTVKTINVGKIKDNTEEITKKVREVLIGKSFFNKRLMEAYPNLQAKIKEKARQIAQKAKEVKTEMSDKVESMKEKITQSASEIKDNIGDKVEEMQKEIRKKPSKKEGK